MMTKGNFETIEELEDCILQYGFLPFFSNSISGFSVEEHTPGHLWFSRDEDGPWEWKGPVVQDGRIAYGSFFAHKTMFVSLDWLPDLICYRRSLPSKVSDDVAALDDVVLQTIEQEGSATIKELRQLLGFARGRHRRESDLVDLIPGDDEVKLSLNPILARLQMQLRIVIKDFEYSIDRHGNRYGWGVARYATPESLYGRAFVHAGERTPEESFQRMYDHLRRVVPSATDLQIRRLIG